ncbi:MAG: CBS domain-containing protein [Nitrosopumilus sp.]
MGSREDFNYLHILIQDIVTRALTTINLSNTLQVTKMIEQGRIGAILVKNNEDLSSIVTDRGFATRVAANNLSFDTPVEKIMFSPLITINHNKSISSAAHRITEKRIRKLAVTENDDVVGIITSKGIVIQLTK